MSTNGRTAEEIQKESHILDREKAKANPKEYFIEWVKDGKYEQDTEKEHYHGPIALADVILRYLPDVENTTILDVGAGTGRVGRYLRERNYKNVDGLDPSDAMLEVARKLNVYGKDFVECIDKSTIEDNTYDCVTVSGSMRYIPSIGLHSMRRVAKPGGFVIISLHEYLLWDLDANGDQHDAMIKSMVNEGLWDQVEKIDVDNYFFGHKGVIFVFKVLKP